MPDQNIDAHPAFAPGGVAVITGAASGIGLAAAKRFAARRDERVSRRSAGDKLDTALADVAALAGSGDKVRAVPTDVSKLADLQSLK